MSKKPIISICIPAYNRVKTLKEGLESIVSQFDETIIDKIEIIVADDASPDAGLEPMVREFSDKYPNIHYHRYEKNMGLASNLVNVTTYGTGEYLRLMADDDGMTDFALKYVLEIIEKENFDLLLCNSVFGPDMSTSVTKQPNTYKTLTGMNEFVDYLSLNRNTYQDLVVYFQFYSILIVKNDDFKKSLASYDQEFIYQNIFPQDIIIYSQIQNKKIIIPDNIFIRGRTLNESYKTSKKFITDFALAMDMIEEANGLKDSMKWQKLKKTVVSGWSRTIRLGWILGWLHIDYKNNTFFKKIYFFYKKHIQNKMAK